MRALPLVAVLLVSALPAEAQERPTDEELFGAPREEEAPTPRPAPESDDARDEAAFGQDRSIGETSQALAPENPLTIGGRFYLLGTLSVLEDHPPKQWPLSAPTLFDLYLDATPNERVRVFGAGRLRYDPTVSEGSVGALLAGQTQQMIADLDRLWLKFDIERTVFVTVGRQHENWGTGRLWNPTDYAHVQKRDPLARLDQRLGTSMVKLHLPWEKYGWNFYALTFLEGAETSYLLGGIGQGFRAVTRLGLTELGLSAKVQEGHKPKFGIDVSSDVADLFDAKAEVALRRDTDFPVFEMVNGVAQPRDSFGQIVQVSGGIEWPIQYSDEDNLIIAADGFYNSIGYDDRKLYQAALLGGGYVPFYLGRYYASLAFILQNPGRWNNTTFMLTTIGNLSDGSALTRLDYSVRVLTHLQVEAFGTAYYGKDNGEFTIDFGSLAPPALGLGSLRRSFDLGMGLRVDL